MPTMVTKQDEELWEHAKQAAAASGHRDDWPYITAIFRKMSAGLEKSVSPVREPMLVLLMSDLEKGALLSHPRAPGMKRYGYNEGTKPPPWPKAPDLSYADKIRQHWGQPPRDLEWVEPAGPLPSTYLPPPKQAPAPRPITEKERVARYWAGRATEAFAQKHGMTQQQVVDKYTQRARERMVKRTPGNPGPEFGRNETGEKLRAAAATFQAENPQFKRYEHESWMHGGKSFADVAFHRIDHGNGHVTIHAYSGKEGAGRRHLGTFTTLDPAQRQLGAGSFFDRIANKMSVMNAGNKKPKLIDRDAEREQYLKKLDAAGIARGKSQQTLTEKSIRLQLIGAI